ncbi:MAG: TIM barrel protein [Verrucomicrobia bacterium]|nr:TIM barrel protein [Verrucomicrobiota bacterium]
MPPTATAAASTLGVAIYAWGIHQRNAWAGRHQGLSPALAFLEECRLLGAGGIQFPFTAADDPHLPELRRRVQNYRMHIEAIVDPPHGSGELDRFTRDVRRAQAAGATLARTVILPGRRYEQFHSLAEFHQAEARGRTALELAEPVLARLRFHLAVENHKDQRIAERLALLRHLSSEFIGACVDVGNNFPLVEDALESVQAFAPYALTVHLKDQAVREAEDGFWLADVPLGDGFLDLPAMVKTLRQAKPNIRFNFETITRDAIKVPILRPGYWTTLADTPARDLARQWHILRTRAHPEPFVAVSRLSRDQQLALERQHLERSLGYARDRLDL